MKLSQHTLGQFQKTIIGYYRKHKRDFPWRSFPCASPRGREERRAYTIFVSEIMLQQTQAERVIPFFNKWMKVFPTAEALARAPLQKVLRLWQGLGYNRRALNLSRSAKIITDVYGGIIPKDIEQIDALPGVGPYTAGAIGAFAFGIPSAFIETNIRTVFLHFFFTRKKKVKDEEILKLVAQTLPNKVRPFSTREWYYALMDYGARLKATVGNLNKRSAGYAKQSAFRGSQRELRGMIVRMGTTEGFIIPSAFKKHAQGFRVRRIIHDLIAEGFLKKEGKRFKVA